MGRESALAGHARPQGHGALQYFIVHGETVVALMPSSTRCGTTVTALIRDEGGRLDSQLSWARPLRLRRYAWELQFQPDGRGLRRTSAASSLATLYHTFRSDRAVSRHAGTLQPRPSTGHPPSLMFHSQLPYQQHWFAKAMLVIVVTAPQRPPAIASVACDSAEFAMRVQRQAQAEAAIIETLACASLPAST